MNNEQIVVELQNKVLEMMKWFHALCVSNDLRYYVICGTMLGAARHQGFIPWDDDIDVAMPRQDYNRLMSMISNEEYGKYRIETPYSEDKNYCYPISKIYDTSTTLIEHKNKNFKRGVFIDIFPLDGLGNDYDEGISYFNKIKTKYNLFLARVCVIRKGRGFKKNLGVILARLIPGFIIDNRKLRIKIDKMCQKYDFDSSAWCGAYLTAWGKKEVFNKNVFGAPTLYKFEDTEIYGIEKYEDYLSGIYGDWRKLPPVEKRVSNHDFVSLDLEKSYL